MAMSPNDRLTTLLFDVSAVGLILKISVIISPVRALSARRTIIAALRSKDAALLRSTLEKNIMIGLELVHEEMKRFRR